MGYIFKADTLERTWPPRSALIPPRCSKTVSDYNAYCDTRENPADGIERACDLRPQRQPMEGDYNVYEKDEGDGPFYAVKGSPWIYSTTGALDVNEKFQVLDTEGGVMEGLYAVAPTAWACLFTEKKEYVTYGGADQGWAFTSGYLAGQGIVDDMLAE